MASASPATADDATVEAQVTVATTCITVDPTSIDYGILSFSEVGAATTSFTNCSAQSQDIFVRGTDASSTTSGATWTLGSSLSCDRLNEYALHVDDLSTLLGPVSLIANNQSLSTEVPSAAVREVNADLSMPCTGSDGAGETFTFSIIFTAVGS